MPTEVDSLFKHVQMVLDRLAKGSRLTFQNNSNNNNTSSPVPHAHGGVGGREGNGGGGGGGGQTGTHTQGVSPMSSPMGYRK